MAICHALHWKLLIVSDTGPINHLLPIGHIGILPLLFKSFMSVAVRAELTDSDASAAVREWMAKLPEKVNFGVFTAGACLAK